MVRAALVAGVVGACVSVSCGQDAAWPQFRGPDAQGYVAGASTAANWNVETGSNIIWKTPIAGLAHSSPVIAGDKMFVTTAIKEGGDQSLKVGLYGSIAPVADDSPYEFRTICLDRRTGEVLWDELSVKAVPAIKRHPKGSHAASSPATDGEYVVSLFASEGMYCYTVDGELVWSREDGVLDSGFFLVKDAQWGFSSSPVIHDGKVVFQCDIQEGSYLAVFDVATGERLWKTDRIDTPGWGTPTVIEHEGRTQIVCNGWKEIAGYDFETGERLWKTDGGGDLPVPTPIAAGDHVFITNAHGQMAPIAAIRLDAEGEFALSDEAEQIDWMYPRTGNYMQTPIVIGERLFLCNDAGIVSAYNRATGERLYRSRLGSGRMGFTASPVAAGDKIYFTSETGEIHVVRPGDEFESIAVNQMGTECMATPAIAGDVIYWRTRDSVIAVGTLPN